MKKTFALIICANLITHAPTISAVHAPTPFVLDLEAPVKESIIVPHNSDDVTAFVIAHKKELAVFAIAITIGLSLKYCSYIQGIVGIDTEDEIDDWRVFIQE